MKPIKYEFEKKRKYINFKDIEDYYDCKESYHYMPEFLEEVYDGANKERLKEANNELVYYLGQQKNYKYLGSWEDKRTISKIDYFEADADTIIGYLADYPKRYYPSLEQVSILKRKNVMS